MRILDDKELNLMKVKKEFSFQLLLIGLVVASCLLFMGMLALVKMF